jgi:hypothetical protein
VYGFINSGGIQAIVDTALGNEPPTPTLETGKHFLHLSFFAPGKDLHDGGGFDNMNVYDLTGKDSLGKNTQGIWGGGAFTKTQEMIDQDGGITIPEQGDTTQSVPGDWNEAWYFGNDEDNGGIVEFEGRYKTHANAWNQPLDLAPAPDVERSRGYSQESNHETLHNRQWDPTWSYAGDSSGNIQKFIDNLQSGNYFRFSGDTNKEVYRIKKVNQVKLYNHTPWRARYIW